MSIILEVDNVFNMDCLEGLKTLEDDSVDLIATDPPYAMVGGAYKEDKKHTGGFMGKKWDSQLPPLEVWKECYRVLKHGSWILVMTSPRMDLQWRMAARLEEAGFAINYTPIYWTFASGFPKASNLGKMADKRLGREREVIGRNPNSREKCNKTNTIYESGTVGKTDYITEPNSPEAKALDGGYAGFQPKPAVEVVLVAMKPLSEKSYIDQALMHLENPERVGLGGTWLDDCRIPYKDDNDSDATLRANTPNAGRIKGTKSLYNGGWDKTKDYNPSGGRFPANLLVSDDVLNDGTITNNWRPSKLKRSQDNGNEFLSQMRSNTIGKGVGNRFPDSGSFSRYFSLDAWSERLPEQAQMTFPFLLVPKASKSEKNLGCETLPNLGGNAGEITVRGNTNPVCQRCKGSKIDRGNGVCTCKTPEWKAINNTTKNNHPTVKPLRLFQWLITLTTRPDQLVLDPYTGSGTTLIAAKTLNRHYIGFELETEYKTIADARLAAHEPEKEQVTEKPLTAF